MGYIKKLKNNELVGGTDKTTIYPVTSTEAVFEEITNGNESSFKSQKTINKEQQDELDDHEERIQAAEAEDIKSITINGSTKKFRVDDKNNVDLTIYTVDNDPEMPSIASNVEDLRNMVGTSTPVLGTSHKTRIETLEGGESVTGSVENKIKTKVDSINSFYQDDDNEYVKYSMTQTSGEVTDFNIDETNLKNAIASLNTSISGDNIVIRSGSTPSGTGEAGKIYRYVNSSNNTYTDYMYSGGSWVPLATHDTSNEQAQVAYYTCTASGSGAQATKQFVSNGSLEYTPSSGGHIKILMGEANTATGTIYLQYNTDSTNTKKPLYYNGEAVSPSNTWEGGEVISVYYDGTYYQASNAQGGGSNKLTPFLVPIKGKISIIGDSISTFNGTMPSGYVTYYPKSGVDVTSVSQTWWSILFSLTKSKREINASYSNSRVTNTSAGLPDFYARTSSGFLGEPDYIIVELGTNDAYNNVALGTPNFDAEISSLAENTFYPAYIKGIKSLKENYPNAKIVLLILMMHEDYAQAIKTIGNHYGLDVIDARVYTHVNGTHPTAKGMEEIANSIVRYFINGKIENYLYNDLSTISVGRIYKENEAVKTVDKQLVKVTKDVNFMNLTDEVTTDDLKVNGNNTYKAQKAVSAYNGSTTYSDGDYAIGRPATASILFEVDAETIAALTEAVEITITINGVECTASVDSTSNAASIATDIYNSFGTQEGWSLSNDNNGTLTLISLTGVATAPVVTSSVGESGVTVTPTSAAGSVTLSQYNSGSWEAVTLANYAADAVAVGETDATKMWKTLNYDDLLGITVQNTEQSYFRIKKKIENVCISHSSTTQVICNHIDLKRDKKYTLHIKANGGMGTSRATFFCRYAGTKIAIKGAKTSGSGQGEVEIYPNASALEGGYTFDIVAPSNYENADIALWFQSGYTGVKLDVSLTWDEYCVGIYEKAEYEKIQKEESEDYIKVTKSVSYLTSSAYKGLNAINTSGSFGSEVTFSSSAYHYTDYVECQGAYMIETTLIGTTNGTIGLLFYDKDKNPIRDTHISSAAYAASATSFNGVKIRVPDNAVYFRNSTWDSNWTCNIYYRMSDSYYLLNKDIINLQSTSEEILSGNLPVFSEESVNTSPLAKTRYTLGSGKKWMYSVGRHIVIPCSEGDKFTLTATNQGNFYGWLRDYTVPTENATVPYVSGTDRNWVNGSVEVELTAPAGTKYLCLVTINGDNQSCVWTGTSMIKEPITDVLSNKASKQYVDNSIIEANKNVNRYVFAPSSYIPIKESAEYYCSIDNKQGGALYGDVYIASASSTGNLSLVLCDLVNKSEIQRLSITVPNSRTHANTLSFGKDKYDDGDDFPILYVCSGYTDTTSSSTTEAYGLRIVGTSGNYTLELVQTITIDFGNINTWTEFVVDNVKNRAWITGSGKATYICVAMPSLEVENYTIDLETTIIDSFTVPKPALGTSTKSSGQGLFFYHNRIYYTNGVPEYAEEGEDALYIRVDNTLTHSCEAVVPLKNFGITREPESCFIWRDNFYVVLISQGSSQNGSIYKIIQN